MDTVPSSGRLGSGNLTLHLGVVIQAYRSRGKKSTAITTGDVAQILEDKYGLMAAYWRVHGDDGAKAIEISLEGAMEALLMGRAVDPWGSAMQKIQNGFKNFISSREAERVGLPNVPTKAALAGINHRLAHPYRKSNPRRASFRDTGIFMNSARAWID